MSKGLMGFQSGEDHGLVHKVSRITLTPEQGTAIAEILGANPDLLTAVQINAQEAVLVSAVEKETP